MENSQKNQYDRGYMAGYRAGLRDAAEGTTLEMIENSVANLPIEAMELSTRAYNCLFRAGCIRVGDVAVLSEEGIARMRNLGAKSASEIAHCLIQMGIYDSFWSDYL